MVCSCTACAFSTVQFTLYFLEHDQAFLTGCVAAWFAMLWFVTWFYSFRGRERLDGFDNLDVWWFLGGMGMLFEFRRLLYMDADEQYWTCLFSIICVLAMVSVPRLITAKLPASLCTTTFSGTLLAWCNNMVELK